MRILLFLLLMFSIASCKDNKTKVQQIEVKQEIVKPAGEDYPDFEITGSFAVDDRAFVEGLFYLDNYLYIGTGLNDKSTISKFNLLTKTEEKTIHIESYFCEGIAQIKDKLYQLTWRNGKCIVYNFKNFEQIKEFDYKGEGWGLTSDGKYLIMSDGTNIIKFINPSDFSEVKSIKVFNEKGYPQYDLNELEYVNGELWANIWTQDKILRINIETGATIKAYDLNPLRLKLENKPDAEALNGIAYNPKSDIFYITGKMWGTIFEIKFKK
jgi:glutaminyl-peptide cyclotransferase